MDKKIIIAANWKMNPDTLKGAKLLFNSVKKGIRNVKKTCPEISQRIEVVICPPFLYIAKIQDTKRKIQIGAQNCFWEEKGAFTGEISLKMLEDLKVKYVIIGHSERRKYFKETDEMISKKLKAVLRAGLKPILCINRPFQAERLQRSLSDSNVILAYEPLSAIGTGKPYSIEKAKKIRKKISADFVLYGGSVNSQNANDYIKKAGFQGLLIGSASLNSKEFIKIIESVSVL